MRIRHHLKYLLRGVSPALAIVLALSCTGAPCKAQEVVVSAAASLTDALREIGTQFMRDNPGIHLRFNFGASGLLQRQIEQGAPVDVFASAGVKEMDALEKEHDLAAGTRRDFASNRLVLIAPKGSKLQDWSQLAGPSVHRIAIAQPESVPAGRYARSTLEHRGLWDSVQARLVFGQNVRQVLTYVVNGDVDAGMVFATDARLEQARVKVVAGAIPGQDHEPILYPAAVIAASGQKRAAGRLVQYLTEPAAQRILKRYGFETAGSAGQRTPSTHR
jgi:molybdate transport system substrate-binding protein